MRKIGTYFEQVPKTVIEKVLSEQGPPAENELPSDEASTKRAPSNVKTRIPKP